ncbi:MAG: molybdenum cofactor guanylyltransferase MobA [Ectothiorhodospiraceae bacterium]
MNEETATLTTDAVTGVVLAGGRATRMGGRDKGLVPVNGKPMIEHVLAALTPQVGGLMINANRNRHVYESYGHTVFGDDLEDYQGPLAGMAGAMARASTPLILTVPCDGPLIPSDLARRLLEALNAAGAAVAVAHDGERLQPVYALLRTDLADSLRAYLDSGERKIDRWYRQLNMTTVDFSDQPELFLNINTPADRDRLGQRMGGAESAGSEP